MTSAPLILSVSSTEVLRATRQLLLEHAGFAVLSIIDIDELDKVKEAQKPTLAVIGHGFPGPEKRKFALALNRRFPGLPILEMCYHSPEIPGADFVFADSPEKLLAAIHDVLAGTRVRGFLP
jgi:hypothetical protein